MVSAIKYINTVSTENVKPHLTKHDKKNDNIIFLLLGVGRFCDRDNHRRPQC